MIKITVLNDDRCFSKNLKHVHGFSLWIDAYGKKYLFDVGQEDCFLFNAKKFNININEANSVILSHGHYDHTNGLINLLVGTKVICHPECLKWRRSKKNNEYNGIPYSEKDFIKNFDVTFSKVPLKITNNIYFLGEIERKCDFECKYFPSTNKDGTDDTAPDDTGIVIDTENGLIIITGCGHSGVCNTINQAKKVTRKNDILAVIGGFHLKQIDEQTKKTIQFMKLNKVKNLYLGHCTSDEVCAEFKNKLSNEMKIEILETGKQIDF